MSDEELAGSVGTPPRRTPPRRSLFLLFAVVGLLLVAWVWFSTTPVQLDLGIRPMSVTAYTPKPPFNQGVLLSKSDSLRLFELLRECEVSEVVRVQSGLSEHLARLSGSIPTLPAPPASAGFAIQYTDGSSVFFYVWPQLGQVYGWKRSAKRREPSIFKGTMGRAAYSDFFRGRISDQADEMMAIVDSATTKSIPSKPTADEPSR